MAFIRDTTLRKAEKLLRQGRLDAAIAEYLQVVENQPRDWNTANILGDLYVRARQPDKAIVQFTRIADHLSSEGFYPKASAVYKKIIKIRGDDEHALLQLAEIAVRQGLLADAKHALTSVAERRRAAGDRRGAHEIRIRLGALDPMDLEARLAGARASVELGETPAALEELKEIAQEMHLRGRSDEALAVLGEAAELSPDDTEIALSLVRAWLDKGDLARARSYAKTAGQLKQLAAHLTARGQGAEALAALAAAAALDPTDTGTRTELARAYLAQGDAVGARQYLSREAAGHDVELLWTLAEQELRGERPEQGIAILDEILREHPERRDQLVLLGCSVADVSVDTAHRVIDLSASAAVEKDEWAAAAAALNEFVNRVPGHIPALMRLVEVCVDGGLEATMYSAQSQLADAYLAAGLGSEARVIAEDLVAREPWDRVNIERFRQALSLLGETDIDAIIADRLSGQTPFMSTDLFPSFDDFDDEVPGVGSAASVAPPPSAPPSPTGEAGPPAEATELGEAAHALEASQAVEALEVDDSAAFDLRPVGGATDDRELFGLASAAIDIGFLSDAIAAPPDRTAVPSVDGAEVDLSNMLETMQPGMAVRSDAHASQDLNGVFKEFRDEVSRENFIETAVQHQKLAMAYLDMGMTDDAIRALEVAVRAPRLRFEAASTLARLYLKGGAPGQAVDWFERAAEAPAPDPEAGRVLLYDLADTLETMGETARALAVLLELQADAGDYRDVSVRLQRLTKVQMRG